MKRIFSYMAALAVLATVGSCQKEPVQPEVEQTPVVELEYQDVTFNVTAPSGPQTKTTYGETVTFETALEVEVYVGEGNAADYGKVGQWLPDVKKSINKISNTEWEVTISLVKNYHYDIVFWAQKKAQEGELNPYYTFDWENGKITADYAVAANDVTRDAFYHLCENYNYLTDGAGQSSYKIQLKRPFAQINLGASDYSALLELYAFVGKKDSDLATTITTATAEVPSVLNVLKGTADIGAPVEFVLAATTPADGSYDLTAKENNINVNEKSYTLVGSNYIFANTHRPDNPTVEMTLTFAYNNQSFDINVPNVPYARNYQTNILGNFFTSEAKFDVVIVPEFEKEDEYVHVWDGYTTSAPAVVDGEYVITTGAELAWVAEQVNAGNDFAGKKVLIASDIRLADYLWTPIGTDEHPFSGSLEALAVTSPLTKSAAEYYTISGLYVNETEGPAGLVGVLNGGEVINLSLVEPNVNGKSFVGAVVGKIFPDGLVEGASVVGGQVNGNHFVGGLVGHAYGSVKNSVVDGTVVTGVSVDEDLDGDKVGGVIGYHAPDAEGTEVSGNKVLDVIVAAKRDAGAVAGAANADYVKNNHVEKATVGSAEAKIEKNAGIIVGRVLAGESDPEANNTCELDNITVNGVQAGSTEPEPEVPTDPWETAAVAVNGPEAEKDTRLKELKAYADADYLYVRLTATKETPFGANYFDFFFTDGEGEKAVWWGWTTTGTNIYYKEHQNELNAETGEITKMRWYPILGDRVYIEDYTTEITDSEVVWTMKFPRSCVDVYKSSTNTVRMSFILWNGWDGYWAIPARGGEMLEVTLP